MTQEQKDLLLKDRCARLPYGVKCACNKNTYTAKGLDLIVTDEGDWEYAVTAKGIAPIEIDFIKPYLFPLSSMTEEQWLDTPYANLNKFTFDSFKCGCSTLAFETYEVNLSYVVEFINWCYKNHFDIYGLIPMGLAEDATGLNIY
jgi:hypothetical protein